MALETGNWVGDLDPANPPGGDPKSMGDDHLRLIKKSLRDSFAGFTGAVLVTGVDGGAINAYTLTPATTLPSYSARMIAVFAPTVTNNGPATLEISGLGAKALVSVAGQPLLSNDLIVGSVYAAFYDGTQFRLNSVTQNYVNQLSFTAALPAQPGGVSQYELRSIGGVASWALRSSETRSARTSNVQLAETDLHTLVEITAGTFTQTFKPAAQLMNGWSIRLKNSGTGDIELESPAAVSTTSASVKDIASATTWNVPSGLGIAPGDLVLLRRTADTFRQRISASVVSYVANTAQTINSITFVGTTATMTTAIAHGRTTGDTIVVSGASPAAYNGTFAVTVLSATTMSYTMLSTPSTNATTVGTYNAGATLTITANYRINSSGVAPVTISTITNAGTLATLTTATAHGLVSGNWVTVAGATPAAYNIQAQVTVVNATTFTYVMATNPGGSATVVGAYTIQYNDWTITTRPAAAAIDGKVSYLMYPGEERIIMTDGIGFYSSVLAVYSRTFTTNDSWVKPPGYSAHKGLIWGGGASGAKSATEAGGSGGGACTPFEAPAAAYAELVTVTIGQGGASVTAANTAGLPGQNSTFGALVGYGGGPGGPNGATSYDGTGGGALSAGNTGTVGGSPGGSPSRSNTGAAPYDGDFGGGGPSGGKSTYGGGGGSKLIASTGGNTLWGGAGSGGYASTAIPGGVSVFGGSGGAGSDTGNGGDGVAPGGAGGSTRTGTRSGAGARGEVRVSGVA